MGTSYFFFETDEASLRAVLRAGALDTLQRFVIDDLDPVSLGRSLAALTGDDVDAWLARIGEPFSDDTAPAERALFWEVPAPTVRQLAERGTGELATRATSACATGRGLYYCLVDLGLFDLVLDLYRLGYPTEAGCEGRLREDEFRTKRHEPRAYLTFAAPLPERLQRALVAEGLTVYAGGLGVASVAIHADGAERPGSIRGYRKDVATHFLEDFREDVREIIAANAAFVERMRRGFGL